MKKLLLASALAAVSLSANAAPELYGRIWMDVGYFEDADVQLYGNARIGLKGDTPLATTYMDDLEAIYKVEFQYNANPDDGTDNFYQRDIYLGLKSAEKGTLRAGRLVTSDDALVVNANYSDFEHSGFYSAFTGARWSDAIDYRTPDMNGLTAGLTYKIADGSSEKVSTFVDNEGQTIDFVDGREIVNDSDSFTLAMNYSPDDMPYAVSASYAGIKGGKYDNAIMLGGKYELNDKLHFRVGYNTTEYNDSDLESTDNMIVSGIYQYTPKSEIYVEYDHTTDLNGTDGDDRDVVSTGVWHDYSKQVSTYASVGYVDVDNDDEDGFGINTGMYFTF